MPFMPTKNYEIPISRASKEGDYIIFQVSDPEDINVTAALYFSYYLNAKWNSSFNDYALSTPSFSESQKKITFSITYLPSTGTPLKACYVPID